MTSSPPVPPDAPQRGKPESLRGRSISASLSVNDIRQSLAWYCDVVGFTIGEQHERNGELQAVELKAGAVEILIGRDDGAKGRDRTKGVGFSIYITTVQSIDDIAARIKSAGGTLDLEPTDTPWGARMIRLKDPDGFTLVIASEGVSTPD